MVSGFCHSGIYPWDPHKADGKKLVPAELFKNDLMPNVNVTVNEGQGDEENTQEEANGSREVESEQAKSPEKGIESSSSGDGNN